MLKHGFSTVAYLWNRAANAARQPVDHRLHSFLVSQWILFGELQVIDIKIQSPKTRWRIPRGGKTHKQVSIRTASMVLNGTLMSLQ